MYQQFLGFYHKLNTCRCRTSRDLISISSLSSICLLGPYLYITSFINHSHSDTLISQSDKRSVASSSFVESLYLEPECGVVGSNWNILTDANASNGEYVQINSGNSYNNAPTSINDRVTMTFTLTTTDIFNVYGRVIAPNGNDDSFWFRMDGGTWYKWNSLAVHNTWAWEQFYDSDNGGAIVTYSLAAGTHTLDIAYREDGARLDKIYISTISGAPSGLGATADNCVPEDCTNGSDDDGDGLIDCLDQDCALVAACDKDGDGIIDIDDLDDDNDGILDIIETGYTTEPCPSIGNEIFPSYDYTNCSTISGGSLFSMIGTFDSIDI